MFFQIIYRTPEEAANEFNIFRDRLHDQLEGSTCGCSNQDFVKQLTDLLQYNRCKLKHCFSAIELLQKELNELMVSRLEASVDKYNLPSEDYDNVGVYLSPKINVSTSTFVISPFDNTEAKDYPEMESSDTTTKPHHNNIGSNDNGNGDGIGKQKSMLSDRRNSRQWKKSDADVEII